MGVPNTKRCNYTRVGRGLTVRSCGDEDARMSRTEEQTLGRDLRRLREEYGLRRHQVAARLIARDGTVGIDPKNIERWELDKVKPSVEHYQQLCAVFGVDSIGPQPKVHRFAPPKSIREYVSRHRDLRRLAPWPPFGWAVRGMDAVRVNARWSPVQVIVPG